jgi:hypothetical protein
MSKITISIADQPQSRAQKSLRSRKRVFDLGEHLYSGAPELCRRTNYWVKKLGKGEEWELYCSQEESLRTREYSGTFAPTELRQYFDDVEFYLDEEEWLDLGLAYTADIIDIREVEAIRGYIREVEAIRG